MTARSVITPRIRSFIRTLLFSLPLAILIGCGGSKSATTTPPPPVGVSISVSGQTVTKARVAGDRIVLLEERLTSLFESGPNRALAISQSDGNSIRTFTPPAGWSLVDFVVHPSGDISAVLTTAREVRIVRLDSNGMIRSDQPFVDSAAAADPFFNYAGGIKDDTALQPALMHDAARLAPLGESLALVLRTGRNAIVAYRLDPDASGAYQQSWRTLVEPGASILGIGLISGSFDVFGQLENHIRVYVDLDSAATLAIGVVNANESNFTFRAHAQYFNQPISATSGVLLTRLATTDGHRLGSTVVDTQNRSELHGVRAMPHGFVLTGRVLSEVRSDGTGWNAFTALIGPDGTLTSYNLIDVDRGDVLFDAAPLPSGRFLAVGTTGYVQNPSGESIS
ncbi:MAG TPA: hypothetical protein VFP40_04260, partial [Terriglobales bacterium]|nr:hypothetical protein [Terriglobales bacterium]